MSAERNEELDPVDKVVLSAIESAVERAPAHRRYRIDIEPSKDLDGELAPAQITVSPVDGRSQPVRIQVDHECQVTLYVGPEERIIELYRNDPNALLTELGEIVATYIST